MQEVIGSSPTISTKNEEIAIEVISLFFYIRARRGAVVNGSPVDCQSLITLNLIPSTFVKQLPPITNRHPP